MSVIHLRTLEEAEAQMRAIAEKYGLGLHHLRGKGRLIEYCAARGECYALLLKRGWTHERIARYFNRRRQTVMAQVDPKYRARRKRYMKTYNDKRQQQGASR